MGRNKKGEEKPKPVLPPKQPDVVAQFFEKFSQAFSTPPVIAALGLFTAFLAIYYSAHPIDDPDIWWHLRTGRLISDSGSVPKIDPFSYVIEGRRWIAHEWLSQWLFWKSWSWGGPYGLFLLREILTGAAFLLLFVSGGLGVPLAAASIGLFGYSIAGMGLVERPWIFSFIFVLGYRRLLEGFSSSERSWRWGIALAAAQALWSNIHGGGSAVGLILIASYAAGFILERNWGKMREYAALFFACVCASLIHPQGVGVYERLFAELFDPMHQWVTEKAPLTPSESRFLPYTIYFILLLASSFYLKGRERIVSLILTLGFGGIFAYSAMRNLAWSFFITCPILLRAASQFLSARPEINLWAAPVFFIFITFAHVPFLRLYAPIPQEPVPLTREWSTGVSDFILRHKPQGRMYNDYVNGGYLIWRLYPRYKVFIDGRGLEYGEEILRKLYMISTQEGFEELDRRFLFDFAVFLQRKDSRLIYLDRHPDWACVYFDDGGLVYAHRKRGSGSFARRWAYRYLRPNEERFDYLSAFAANPADAAGVMEEIDRTIRESPPDLAANAYFMKSYFLNMWSGPVSWARWYWPQRDRFEWPGWRSQAAQAWQILNDPSNHEKEPF